MLLPVITRNEVAVVWGTDLLWHFLTPCGGFDILGIPVVVLLTVGLNVGCVALGFKPSAANLLRGPSITLLALLDQRLEACLHCVVERYFLEAYLARLPEGVIITLSLLHGFELRHKSIVAGGDVLVPTFLNLLFLKLLDMLDFDDTQRPIYIGANKIEVWLTFFFGGRDQSWMK